MDHESPKVHTCNLGDSSYLWLRKSGLDLEKLYRAKEQTQGFNFPLQVGTNGNNPTEGDIRTHDVQENDIFILATDGLFDNVYERDVISIVRPFIKHTDEIIDLDLVAEMIAQKAEDLSKDPKYISPFARDAHDHYYDFVGGKEDDVTVVVG